MLSVGQLVAALTGVPAGHIVDRLGTQRITIAGLGGIVAGCTGASMMGALFAFASRAADITTASPEAVAGGMRITFGAAAILIAAALTIASGNNYFSFDSFRPRSMSSGSTIGSRPRNAR